MAQSVRAELSEKVKRQSLIKIAVVGTISVIGLILAVYSIVRLNFLFAFLYLVAGVMGALYTIIEINFSRVPFVECDGEKLVFSTWDNNIFPYKVDFKPKFFADFVPSKAVSYEITLDDVADMAIGSKGFLTKALKSLELDRKFAEFSVYSKRVEGFVKRCDILCVRLKDGSIYMMSVKSFDMDELYRIVDMTEHQVQGLEFKTSVRQLRKKRETI